VPVSLTVALTAVRLVVPVLAGLAEGLSEHVSVAVTPRPGFVPDFKVRVGFLLRVRPVRRKPELEPKEHDERAPGRRPDLIHRNVLGSFLGRHVVAVRQPPRHTLQLLLLAP